jgi:hypothetical protein
VEALALLTTLERELEGAGEPLGDAWSRGVDAARDSRASALGGWMARVQGLLAIHPDDAWQRQRRESPSWTAPALPRRVVGEREIAAALRLVDPGALTRGIQEVAWVGGGHVLLLGEDEAWIGSAGGGPRRLALPSGVRGALGLIGTYARAPWEVAVRARRDGEDVAVLLRLDGPGGPRSLGLVPLEGPCGTEGLELRRLGEREVRLEILRDCGGTRLARDLWPLRQGRYRPERSRSGGQGFRVVLRG